MAGPATTEQVQLTVNGRRYERVVESRMHLGDFLRHELGLTGTHIGCEHGVCGSCTIILNGAPVRSCLMFAGQAAGADITTVEGLAAADGTLHPIQHAFWQRHGLQCGFCTPGFLTTITAGLRANPDPTHDEARDMVAGNLCRCTGYQNIVKAVERAAEIARGLETGAERPPQPPVEQSGHLPFEDREDDIASTGLGA